MGVDFVRVELEQIARGYLMGCHDHSASNSHLFSIHQTSSSSSYRMSWRILSLFRHILRFAWFLWGKCVLKCVNAVYACTMLRSLHWG